MRSPVAVGGGSGSSAAKVRQRGGAPLLLGQQQGQQQGELQEQPLQHLPREDQRASSLCFRRLRLVTPVAFLLVIVLLLVLILQPPGEQQLQQQEEQQRREQLEACAASAVAPGVVLPALKASTRVCSRTELRNPAHNPLPAAHPEYDFSAAELEQAEQTPEGEAVLAGSLSYAVTFAVLPRRYYLLPAVLGNLLRQSHVPPPTLVVVNAPSFPEESLACWTDDRVAVRVLPDVGPITKVLYTIRDQDNASALAYRPSLLDAATGTVVWAVANLDLTGVDAFLVCDDDNIKGPLWAWLLLRRLVELQILRGRKVHELHQLQAAAADEGVLANANSSLTIARLQREAESLARPAFLSLASIVRLQNFARGRIACLPVPSSNSGWYPAGIRWAGLPLGAGSGGRLGLDDFTAGGAVGHALRRRRSADTLRSEARHTLIQGGLWRNISSPSPRPRAKRAGG